jgi:hypothetical protein
MVNEAYKTKQPEFGNSGCKLILLNRLRCMHTNFLFITASTKI